MIPEAPELTVEDARVALEQHVCTTTWLRRDLSRTLPIESLERSGSFHIVFKSFTEERETVPAFVPYRGEAVDGPSYGPAPEPWEMPVALPGKFIHQDHYEPVPHTDVVQTCHGCQGSGKVTCSECTGSGRTRCSRCGGDGRVDLTRTLTRTNAQGQTETYTEHYTERCDTCGGDGLVTCGTCGGSGQVTCPTCQGATRLKHYRKLHVAFRTHTAQHVIEKTDLPDHLVQGAIGILIHAEEAPRLEPRAGGGGGPYRGEGRVSPEVNEAANGLIRSHAFAGGVKLHCQALSVRAVPVYEARYRWGKEHRRFWVFGNEHQVYAPNYPLSIARLTAAIGIPTAVVCGLITLGAMQSKDARGPTRPPPRPTPALIEPVYSPYPTIPPPSAQPAPVSPATGNPPVIPKVKP